MNMTINIARLDLVSMRLAVLCAQTGSLTAAVKQAHFSISAGSQRLTALEEMVGTPLFVRGRRGLQPTAFGEVFVQHARTILNHVEALTEHVATADRINEERPVRRVCMSHQDMPAPVAQRAWAFPALQGGAGSPDNAIALQ